MNPIDRIGKMMIMFAHSILSVFGTGPIKTMNKNLLEFFYIK